VAVAIAFITVAVPLKLDAHWITIGWLIESAVLLYVGVKSDAHFLRIFAGCTLALGVMLMATSYAYHRDWFKLSPKKSGGGTEQETAS
jgi:uncharacterized membrane protein